MVAGAIKFFQIVILKYIICISHKKSAGLMRKILSVFPYLHSLNIELHILKSQASRTYSNSLLLMHLPLLVWKVSILLGRWWCFHVSILLTAYSLYMFQLLCLRLQAARDPGFWFIQPFPDISWMQMTITFPDNSLVLIFYGIMFWVCILIPNTTWYCFSYPSLPKETT